MAALLVAIAIMGVLIAVVLPAWSHAAKREREAELVFRGEQYVRAIELYQRQYVGAYPPDLDTLIDERFLRRLYTDPMTDDGQGEFRPVYRSQLDDDQGGPATAARPGEVTTEPEASGSRLTQSDREEGGIVGVVSTSEESSVRIYNGQQQYNEWAFVYETGAGQPGGESGVGGASPSQQELGGGGATRGQARPGARRPPPTRR
jgi:type II secretory pathway pseudopilin PulG